MGWPEAAEPVPAIPGVLRGGWGRGAGEPFLKVGVERVIFVCLRVSFQRETTKKVPLFGFLHVATRDMKQSQLHYRTSRCFPEVPCPILFFSMTQMIGYFHFSVWVCEKPHRATQAIVQMSRLGQRIAHGSFPSRAFVADSAQASQVQGRVMLSHPSLYKGMRLQ